METSAITWWPRGFAGCSVSFFFILVEGVFEFPSLKKYNVAFIFEDLLLGIAALCALSEEVRLFKRALRPNELSTFRKVTPAHQPAEKVDDD